MKNPSTKRSAAPVTLARSGAVQPKGVSVYRPIVARILDALAMALLCVSIGALLIGAALVLEDFQFMLRAIRGWAW